MDTDMGMSGSDSSGPLTAAGVDFSNETQAFNFLQEILDDSVLGVQGNQYARYFWYGTAVFVGIGAVVNLVDRAIMHARIRASSARHPSPAKPSNAVTKAVATTVAILRELSYLQITPVQAASWVKVPPFGTVFICAGYFAFIVALVFMNNDIPGAQHYQSLGIRAGWLGVAQLPLLVLLSSKINLIGLLCNSSYERLNVYHRWVARGLLLLATFHFAFQSHGWNLYGLMTLEWDTDSCPPTGMAAYALLLWMNLTTLPPLRHLSYKFFVIQHLLTYFGFTIALAYHVYGTTSPYATNYIYISAALYIVGQIIRFVWNGVKNLPPTTCTLTALGGGATRIRVSKPHVKSWRPGSHARMYMPHFDFLQGHPATILSTPTSHDGDLIFLLRSYKGFTRKIHKAATADVELQQQSHYRLLVDGPYFSSHADFGCFDTLVLIAGSTGVTFTLSNLLDIAHRVKLQKLLLPLRIVHFTWVIKKQSWISWVHEELQAAFEKLEDAGIETNFNIYITCDDSITRHRGFSSSNSKAEGCQCTGGCKCCQQADEVDAAIGQTAEKKDLTSDNATNMDTIPYATVHTGRPAFRNTLAGVICQAQGETAVAVCGPLGLSASVRSAVVWASDELAVSKGSGLQGVYLHVENFV